MKMLASVLLIMVAVPAMAKDKHIVQVEVLSAKTRHWTTVWHDDGSPGTQKTDCTSYGDNDATCTTKTEGYRAPSDTPIQHTRVDLQIKMPDGSTVTTQCHYPPVWATCFEPQSGTYDARIDKHSIHLLIPMQGRPEYNSDGTLKKAGKISETEIKLAIIYLPNQINLSTIFSYRCLCDGFLHSFHREIFGIGIASCHDSASFVPIQPTARNTFGANGFWTCCQMQRTEFRLA